MALPSPQAIRAFAKDIGHLDSSPHLVSGTFNPHVLYPSRVSESSDMALYIFHISPPEAGPLGSQIGMSYGAKRRTSKRESNCVGPALEGGKPWFLVPAPKVAYALLPNDYLMPNASQTLM